MATAAKIDAIESEMSQDFLRPRGDKAGFEKLTMQYALRFENSAPGWLDYEPTGARVDPKSDSFPTRRSSDLPTSCGATLTAPGRDRPPASTCWRPGTWPSRDRKSTRLNSSHTVISYAVFCLKKKTGPQPGNGHCGQDRRDRVGDVAGLPAATRRQGRLREADDAVRAALREFRAGLARL